VKVQDFQQALQGYVQKHGIGKLPVDYEELRPLLMAMQRVAERRGIEVVVFDKRIWGCPRKRYLFASLIQLLRVEKSFAGEP